MTRVQTSALAKVSAHVQTSVTKAQTVAQTSDLDGVAIAYTQTSVTSIQTGAQTSALVV